MKMNKIHLILHFFILLVFPFSILGLVVVNPNITFINDSFYKLKESSPNNLPAKALTNMIHSKLQDKFIGFLSAYIKSDHMMSQSDLDHLFRLTIIDLKTMTKKSEDDLALSSSNVTDSSDMKYYSGKILNISEKYIYLMISESKNK